MCNYIYLEDSIHSTQVLAQGHGDIQVFHCKNKWILSDFEGLKTASKTIYKIYYLLLKEAFLHMNQALVLHWRPFEERATGLTLAASVIYKLPVDKSSFRGPERARTSLVCAWQLIIPLLIMLSHLLGKGPGWAAGPERGQQHFRNQTSVIATSLNPTFKTNKNPSHLQAKLKPGSKLATNYTCITETDTCICWPLSMRFLLSSKAMVWPKILSWYLFPYHTAICLYLQYSFTNNGELNDHYMFVRPWEWM